MSHSKSMQQFRDYLGKLDIKEMPRMLQAAAAAAEKRVTINIALDDQQFLKDNGYSLCIAKRTKEHSYNVIWSSYDKYVARNMFSWVPLYELFGSNTFQDGIRVETLTNMVQIGLGETSLLNEAGILKPPTTGGPEESITMNNEYGAIHPGLNQVITTPKGTQASIPFYLAENQIAAGSVTMTPVEKVQVWFEQKVQTGTMFSTARSNAVEIDLTFSNDETRTYKDGRWIK